MPRPQFFVVLSSYNFWPCLLAWLTDLVLPLRLVRKPPCATRLEKPSLPRFDFETGTIRKGKK